MAGAGAGDAGELGPDQGVVPLTREVALNYRRLGRSGLKVSELSLGSWTTYGGSVDNAEAIAIVRRAFELGVNLFDTADVYVRGAAETVLGEALSDLPREQLVIATKCMGRVWDGPLGAGLSRKHIFDALDQSLRRLRHRLHRPLPAARARQGRTARGDAARVRGPRALGQGALRRVLELRPQRRRSTARCSSCSRRAAGTS